MATLVMPKILWLRIQSKKSFLWRVLKKLRFLCRHRLALILLSAKKNLPKRQKDAYQWTLLKVQDGLLKPIKLGQDRGISATRTSVLLSYSKFVTEARREDGSPYPPKTLYEFLCELLRHSRVVQEDPPNFLDQKDVRFKKLHGTCNWVFRGLHENGVDTARKSAKIISEEIENQLWETDTLNVTTHKDYRMPCSFMLGKCVVWEVGGGEEQRN